MCIRDRPKGYPTDPQDLWFACRWRAPYQSPVAPHALPGGKLLLHLWRGDWCAQAVLAYHPGAAALRAAGTADPCRLYVRGLCVVPPGARRGRSVFFIKQDTKSGLGRDELPRFFGGWQLNAADRFLCIGQSGALLRSAAGYQKRRTAARQRKNKVKRRSAIKGSLGRFREEFTVHRVHGFFIFRLADANGDVDLARALHDHGLLYTSRCV